MHIRWTSTINHSPDNLHHHAIIENQACDFNSEPIVRPNGFNLSKNYGLW